MSRADRLPSAPGGLPLDALDRDGALSEAAERLPRIDRGDLLRAGVISVLAVGLGWPRAASAADRNADFDVLNYALSLEYLQAAFYTEAERLKSLRGEFKEQARVVGSHERAHVKAFGPCSATKAIKEPKFDFQGVTEDQSKFRSTAVAFEDLAAAAYKEEAPRLHNPEFLAAAVQVHSVEARHAAWIRRLAGVVTRRGRLRRPEVAQGGQASGRID